MNSSNCSYNLKFIFTYLILGTVSYMGSAENLKDTTFLYRKVSGNSYHEIFIDANPHSAFYNNLIKGISVDKENYDGVIQQLKD